MKITTGQINGVSYELFKAVVPTDNYVLWEHGIGDESAAGVTDGSQLSKMDITGTWLSAARAGFEFPFNIIAPQIDNAKYSDWWHLTNGQKGNEAWFLNWVKETLKANIIGATGYSLGGRGVWNLLQFDTKNYLSFIAPVCGFYDFSQGPITNLRTVPVYGVHGDKDPTMSYSQDVATQQAYSSGRPNQIINSVSQPCYYLLTIPGAGHSVWPIAYDVTSGKDGLLQWVNQQFGPAVAKPDVIVSSVFDGVNRIDTTQSGKVLTFKPTTIN